MNVLAIIGRLLYTPTEYCRACREPIWTIFSRQVVCGTCRRLLLDSRSRTSSRERTALSMVLDPLPEAEFEEASEQLDRLRREVHASRLRAFTARPFECAACGRLYDTRKLAGCSVCGSTIRLRAKEAA